MLIVLVTSQHCCCTPSAAASSQAYTRIDGDTSLICILRAPMVLNHSDEAAWCMQCKTPPPALFCPARRYMARGDALWGSSAGVAQGKSAAPPGHVGANVRDHRAHPGSRKGCWLACEWEWVRRRASPLLIRLLLTVRFRRMYVSCAENLPHLRAYTPGADGFR
jgi:hypothetical protein